MNTSKTSKRLKGGHIAIVASIAVLAVGCAKATTAPKASPTVGASGSTTPFPTLSTPATPTATSSPTPLQATPSTTTAAGVALTSVDWSAVTYGGPHFPTDCKPDVMHVSYAAPATATPVAIVQVSCQAGAGTPPSALLVFDAAETITTPHLTQTLVSYYDGWAYNSFSSEGSSISVANALGSSSSGQPADLFANFVWAWEGGGYQLQTKVPSHVPVCGAPTCTPITSLGEATSPAAS